MGLPAPTGVEQAAQVSSGQFTNTGTSTPMLVYGQMNFAVWGVQSTTLTTTNGSTTASITTNTGLVVGQSVNSTNVPTGTVIGAVSTNTINLSFPPGFTNGNVSTAADANAKFSPATFGATLRLERSFDGGVSYIVAGIGAFNTNTLYTNTAVSIVTSEPEKGVFYRTNVIGYTSGTVAYRISTQGVAASAWGIQP